MTYDDLCTGSGSGIPGIRTTGASRKALHPNLPFILGRRKVTTGSAGGKALPGIPVPARVEVNGQIRAGHYEGLRTPAPTFETDELRDLRVTPNSA